MKRTVSFFIIFLLLITLFREKLHSQKLYINIETGYKIGFNSYSPFSFLNKFNHIFKPLSSPDYQIRKLPDYSLTPPPISFGLKYINQKNEVDLSYLIYECASNVFYLSYNTIIDIDEDGNTTYADQGLGMLLPTSLRKIQLTYSYSIPSKNRHLNFAPIVGINFFWLSKGYDSNKNFSFGTWTLDNFFGYDSTSSVKINYKIEDIKFSYSVLLGASLKFKTKKRDLFALKVYYELAFKTISMWELEIFRNKNIYHENIYTKGSQLCAKISIPIKIYDIGKHKMNRSQNLEINP